MAYLVNPLLWSSLGTEMVYVLDQRLRAQSIPSEKSAKVLQYVVEEMLSENRLLELFNPESQEFALSQLKDRFEAIVNGTIMRLNESSMGKLFDLAIMCYKYQLCATTSLMQLLDVAVRHFEDLSSIMASWSVTSTKPIITRARSKLEELYWPLSSGQLHRARQGLLRVLQEKRVKATVLLEAQIQTKDGELKLVRPIGSKFGHISEYDDTGGSQTSLISGYVDPYVPYSSAFNHELQLGRNLYVYKQAAAPKPTSAHDISVPEPTPDEEH